MVLPLCSNILIFLCGIVLVFIFRVLYSYVHARLMLCHVPGPKATSLIWGEEWNLYSNVPGKPYAEWHAKYGHVIKFNGAFGHQVISLADHRAISFILGENTHLFPKAEGVRAWFKATLGEGILWVEGKVEHERQRRLLAPAFSQQAVRNLTPVIFETSAKLAAQWNKILDDQHTKWTEIEVTYWAGRFALDVIGRVTFTYDFGFLSQHETGSLAEVLDGLTNNENKTSSFYMRALFWIFPPILAIGKKGEMIRRTKEELGSIASRMWQDAKAIDDKDGRTMMALMLRAEAAGTGCLDTCEAIAQMRTIISAGYETVSAVVAWMLYELAIHPTIQNQIRDEVASIKTDSVDILNNQCPLLDCVLKETLRLHPSILENHHEASTTISIPLDNPIPGSNDMHMLIPKGTLLVIPLNVIHQDPEIWGRDAHEFRPERWLERRKCQIHHPHELLTFTIGPRTCIGKAFAMAEIKILMVTLLQQFAFTCKYEIEAFQSFVVRPRIKGQGPSSLPLSVRRL